MCYVHHLPVSQQSHSCSTKAGPEAAGPCTHARTSSLPSPPLSLSTQQVFEAKSLGQRVLVQESWCGEKQLLLQPSSSSWGQNMEQREWRRVVGWQIPFSPSAPVPPHPYPPPPYPAFPQLLSMSVSCPTTLIQLQTSARVQTPRPGHCRGCCRTQHPSGSQCLSQGAHPIRE